MYISMMFLVLVAHKLFHLGARHTEMVFAKTCVFPVITMYLNFADSQKVSRLC